MSQPKVVFTYSPEGAKPYVWDFEPGRMKNEEAEGVERFMSASKGEEVTFVEWAQSVLRGGALAARVFVFVMLSREKPGLKFNQVGFSMSEIEIEIDEDLDDEDDDAESDGQDDDGGTLVPDEDDGPKDQTSE